MNRKAAIARGKTVFLLFIAAVVVAVISAMAGIRTASAEAGAITQHYAEVETLPVIVYDPIPYYDIPLSFDFQQYVTLICDAHSVDPSLAFAVMWRESNYNADAVNASESCYGLMQIHKCNFARYGLDKPLDAYANVTAGIKLLGELTNKYGDVHKVLMAYNCGEGRAAELWLQGITSTAYSRDVVEKVAEINEKGRECVEVP